MKALKLSKSISNVKQNPNRAPKICALCATLVPPLLISKYSITRNKIPNTIEGIGTGKNIKRGPSSNGRNAINANNKADVPPDAPNEA